MADKTTEIWTEGKTDWKILKKAQEKLAFGGNIKFNDTEKIIGDAELITKCRILSEVENDVPKIFIFDNDNDKIIKVAKEDGQNYKCWGNNIYSLVIPVPEHRKGHESISIEHYFTDEEIKTQDKDGRRLFLSNEFNVKSGKLITDTNISIANCGSIKNHTKEKTSKIVDNSVFDENHLNIALSKNSFAEHIINDSAKFIDFDFSSFKEIFNVVDEIISECGSVDDLFMIPFDTYSEKLSSLNNADKFTYIFDSVIDLSSLALFIFISSTVGFYKDEIVNEVKFRKKVKPIKKVISERFSKPAFTTIIDLANKCFHLVESSAPEQLTSMKNCLKEDFLLEDIGHLLDQLEVLFPPKEGSVVFINKSNSKKDLIGFVFPQLARFINVFSNSYEDNYKESLELDSELWLRSLYRLKEKFSCIFENEFVLKKLSRPNPLEKTYILDILKYQNNSKSASTITISAEDVDSYQGNMTEMSLGEQNLLAMFPFMLIKDNSLYFYNKTTSSGYVYHSPKSGLSYIYDTKKKFNHAVFKTGSRQELFWTEVLPTINPENNVRANIPSEGLLRFVGRKQYKRIIKQEIIEIPNQNGIIYGPGGIGKTALMLQVSKELYDTKPNDELYFENIIWVSAKSDYYDYIHNVVEKKERQVNSLENILLSVLDFFEYEDIEEYSLDEIKDIFIDLLKHKNVLLVIDNFETIPTVESNKIIKYFDIDVKRELRKKPDVFKVIITSRKQIPSGFHQIELKGLGSEEAKELMDTLFEKYREVKEGLSLEQKESLYESTKGIPIVIKHCFVKIYEFNEPFSKVLRDLPQISTEIIKFSFKEILNLIQKKEEDGIKLKILILLEIYNRPIMLRQISDILDIDEYVIEDNLPALVDYQCVKRIYDNEYEKYVLNDEVRLMTKGLLSNNKVISSEIRKDITKNVSLDKRLNYTQDEIEIIAIFNNYLNENSYLEAEDFIKSQLKKLPDSLILNLHFAKYLKDNLNSTR